MAIKRFEEIEGWQTARTLCTRLHEVTRGAEFRNDDDLRRQVRRAAISVMANIAEGFDTGSDAAFARHLRIARASASEVQSHLYVGLDSGFVSDEDFHALYDLAADAKRRISAFLKYLNRSESAR